jgi:hypothetical protein
MGVAITFFYGFVATKKMTIASWRHLLCFGSIATKKTMATNCHPLLSYLVLCSEKGNINYYCHFLL